MSLNLVIQQVRQSAERCSQIESVTLTLKTARQWQVHVFSTLLVNDDADAGGVAVPTVREFLAWSFWFTLLRYKFCMLRDFNLYTTHPRMAATIKATAPMTLQTIAIMIVLCQNSSCCLCSNCCLCLSWCFNSNYYLAKQGLRRLKCILNRCWTN